MRSSLEAALEASGDHAPPSTTAPNKTSNGRKNFHTLS
jgi:hypothetical protein